MTENVNVPSLTPRAIINLAAITVHTSNLIDDVFMGDQHAQLKEMRILRELIADHEIMALRFNLDRQGLLPEKR